MRRLVHEHRQLEATLITSLHLSRAGRISAPENKGSLLQMLLDGEVNKSLFATPVVKAIVLAKWNAFARLELMKQAAAFAVQLALFITWQVGFICQQSYPTCAPMLSG